MKQGNAVREMCKASSLSDNRLLFRLWRKSKRTKGERLIEGVE